MGFGSRRVVLGAALAACGVAAGGVGFFGYAATFASHPRDTVSHAVQAFFVPDPQKLYGKKHVRVLLVGLDYDYDAKDQESSKQSRSDIIMAIDFDLGTHRIAELSVPRDMVATMPDGTVSKINAAQSRGGISLTRAVVAKWLGVPGFDRYAVLRIDTAKDLVDAIGGVDVEVKNSDALRHVGPNGPIDYDDHWGHLAIHLKPGLQHLNGESAVAYARFRHDWCSDPCRIERQQQLMHAVVDKIERDRFNTLTHIRSLLAVMHSDVETDITPREQLSIAVAFAHVGPKDIRTAQVPYTSTVRLPGEGDSLVADESEKRRLSAAMLLQPEDRAVATVTGTQPPTPSNIRIRVENGTRVAGLAARIAADLRRRGFVISQVADARSHDIAATQIHGRNDSGTTLEVVRKALGSGVSPAAALADAPPTTAPGAVTVILGQDITASLPDAPAGSP